MVLVHRLQALQEVQIAQFYLEGRFHPVHHAIHVQIPDPEVQMDLLNLFGEENVMHESVIFHLLKKKLKILPLGPGIPAAPGRPMSPDGPCKENQ